ncbi:transposase [Lysinibacillus sp. NPDC095746]|uniref:transposase n=1 Tax=Lysinibacillus sp. NPDC095746 TaxID=3364134 RepID=UPI00380C4D25
MPIEPNWGIKKNSDGKNTFWFGFKGHLVVTTKSQYIASRLMTSGNLSDSKTANPLLKEVENLFPGHFTTTILDARYDFEPIYRQLHEYQMRAVIHYKSE